MDSAWLDGDWAGGSFPNQTAPKGNQNFRFQSQWWKYNYRVNIAYVNGYSGAAKPSQLAWGQFCRVFRGPVTTPDGLKRWADPLSNGALDAADIAP